LEHEIEGIERAALASLHAAAPEKLRQDLGLHSEEVDGALVSMAAGDPSILLNRVIGLGVGQMAKFETPAVIRGLYSEASIGRHFLHLSPDAASGEFRAGLDAAGYQAYRRWMKFSRQPLPPAATRTDLQVREIGLENAADFGRIVAPAFDMTDASAPLLAALVGHPGWHIYMSFDGDEPAGAGALFVRDGIAWCDWAGTDPAFRRRGSQGAVLAARIAKANELGCRLIATETGEAVEGDSQHSYHNIERAGFKAAYLRDNFVPRD